jgi:O-antigen ligase
MYFPLAVSSIILTNSRIGLLAFVAFLSLLTMGGRNLSRVLAGLTGGLVLLAVTWLLMPESNRHRLETLWAPTEGSLNDESAVASAEGRKLGFLCGMEMFQRFPATGVGLNNFSYYRKTYLDGDIHAAHNTYASVLGETGAVGGAAFVFFIVAIFNNVSRTNRLAKVVPDPMVQLLARLAIACRRSILLLLFVGAAGDYQGFAPLYWIAAYCLLARHLATMVAQTLQAQTFAKVEDREDLWLPSSQVLSSG